MKAALTEERFDRFLQCVEKGGTDRDAAVFAGQNGGKAKDSPQSTGP